MTSNVKAVDKGDKRQLILEGALRAFSRKGFYNTRISEVAAEAGVADGTIYLYFKNKDDVLISLFEDRMEWLIRHLSRLLQEADGGFRDKLRTVVEHHVGLAVTVPELAVFITVELRQSSKFVKEYKNQKFQEYLGIINQLIVSGQEEGVVRQDIDARITSRLVFGALDEALLSLTLSKSSSREVKVYTEQVLDILFSGLS